MKTNLFFITLIITSFLSCTKVSNNGIPSYIKLENPTIETSSLGQGSSLHSFTDLWISERGTDLGAYEYPKTFPVLFSGEKEITINPGVMFNADKLDRRIHPVFEPFKEVYNFELKDTVVISPIFKYRESVDFLYIEDFESSNNFDNFVRTDINDTENIEKKCGVLTLSNSEKNKTALTISPIKIPQGKRTYMEFSLKTESYTGIGFQSANGTQQYTSLVVFSPNTEWNTYYFEITNFINSTKDGEYHFYLNSQKAQENEEEKTYFDNFKIMAF